MAGPRFKTSGKVASTFKVPQYQLWISHTSRVVGHRGAGLPGKTRRTPTWICCHPFMLWSQTSELHVPETGGD